MKIYVRRDCKTVNEAVSAANAGDTIIIPSGVYKEKINICKKNISLIGDGFVTVTYDAAAGNTDSRGIEYNTFTSATVTVDKSAEGFKAENITFENSYNRIDSGRKVTQALAMSCAADGAVFDHCNFLGWQDTLYLCGESHQYVNDCYIEGSVDFIFGDATVLFEDCDINCVREKSYITAASTADTSEAGFVFYHCYISACDNCGNIYLGRPWRAHTDGVNSHTAFIECTYNFDCAAEGWLPWHLEPGTEADNTRYLEYKNIDEHGHLIDVSKRVPWSRQLTHDEAEKLMSFVASKK